jgi:hypothetical protein
MQLPSSKHDVESVERLVELGFEQIEPFVPELLEWLQDLNWPVARPLARFFVTVGSPLAEHVRRILGGTDDSWKHSVLTAVVSQSSSLANALRVDLEKLASSPTPSEHVEGVDEVCVEILATLRFVP